MFKYIVIFLLFLFSFVNFKIWGNSGIVDKILVLQNDIKLQKELIAKLQVRNETLAEEVKYLKTNQDSIMEFYGRRDFGLIKEKEKFFVDRT